MIRLRNIPSGFKFWRYPFLLKLKYGLISLFNKDAVCVKYWISSQIFAWSTKIQPYNWGDYVNQYLAELISGKRVIPYNFHKGESVAMMGSILPWAMTADTIVWGSGCLDSGKENWKYVEKPKDVKAVRGPLTRELLLSHGIDCPEMYGDPALLFPKYYKPNANLKRHRYGVVFHVSSLKEAEKWIEEKQLDDVLVISPTHFDDWRNFIDQICSCDIVLSSSLHGVIVADAYHIPNLWVSLTGNEHPDGNFKFKDYYLSVGKSINEPYNIKALTDGLISDYIKEWQEPSIDLDKLLAACPFVLRKD